MAPCKGKETGNAKCARADSRTLNRWTDSEERPLPILPGNGVLEQNCSRAEESAGELPHNPESKAQK
jgi:hypothetical protein